MSGHSKWNNIKRRKEAVDSKRGKIFTKLGREIQLAVKQGGADPESNRSLQDAINRAKSNNMPNDSIQRSIKRAAGMDNTDNYEEVTYEGYGPGGVAVLVRTLTDNRNRTAGEVRHIFDKYGGNLGTTGCVSFQFEQRGVLLLDRENNPDEDTVMMDALDSGADDVSASEEGYEIMTSVEDYYSVQDNLKQKGYNLTDATLGPVPNITVEIKDPEIEAQLDKLIDFLEDIDDVQDVYHNRA